MDINRIKEVIKKQRLFFTAGKTLEADQRIDALKKLRNSIVKNEALINDALYKDLKKPHFESYATEIGSIIEEIDYAIDHLKSWMKPSKVKTPLVLFYSKSKVQCEPFGLVLIIGTWNYPFALSLIPLVGAIAAGNCAIIKPSEVAPNCSKALHRIIKESFSDEYVAVVEGDHKIASKLLNQKFDYIFFTGGTKIGKIVAKSASKNLTPVTLELGGKSPCIVNDSDKIKVIAKRIVWGKFINAGQTCVAPDYVLVKKELKEDLVKNMKDVLIDFYSKNPQKSHDYCRIINSNHFVRLSGLLKKGNIIAGGELDKKSLYIAPTIIDGVSWNDPVMKEEIFGPILPIIEYGEIEDAIKKVNNREKPLTIYLFSQDDKIKNMIERHTSSGSLCINATILHTSNIYLPFGGVGASGAGNYHGRYSFETFSHKKSIMEKSFWPDLDISYPPYKGKLETLKKIWGRISN